MLPAESLKWTCLYSIFETASIFETFNLQILGISDAGFPLANFNFQPLRRVQEGALSGSRKYPIYMCKVSRASTVIYFMALKHLKII
jgi:hypothetical protein